MENIFYNTDEVGGGSTDIQANEPETFKTFATEEEYNKVIKSETSKAKNSLLQEIGIKSVQEGREALTKASELEAKIAEIETKYTQAAEELVIVSANIKPEFKEEALTLAKAKVTEEVPLDKALEAVVAKLPHLLNIDRQQTSIGGDRKESEEKKVSDFLANKYPHLI